MASGMLRWKDDGNSFPQKEMRARTYGLPRTQAHRLFFSFTRVAVAGSFRSRRQVG
jgi:hypothetical protein